MKNFYSKLQNLKEISSFAYTIWLSRIGLLLIVLNFLNVAKGFLFFVLLFIFYLSFLRLKDVNLGLSEGKRMTQWILFIIFAEFFNFIIFVYLLFKKSGDFFTKAYVNLFQIYKIFVIFILVEGFLIKNIIIEELQLIILAGTIIGCNLIFFYLRNKDYRSYIKNEYLDILKLLELHNGISNKQNSLDVNDENTVKMLISYLKDEFEFDFRDLKSSKSVILQNIAIASKFGFRVDWKVEFQDIFSEISTVLLNKGIENRIIENGKGRISLLLLDTNREITFDDNVLDKDGYINLHYILKTINPFLSDYNLIIVEVDTGGDEFAGIILDINNYKVIQEHHNDILKYK